MGAPPALTPAIRRLLFALILATALALPAISPAGPYLTRLGYDFLLYGRALLSSPVPATPDSAPDSLSAARQKVAVIAIDEQTYRTPPFNGLPKVAWTQQIATVLEAVTAASPRVIGFDLIFPTSLDRPDLLQGYDRRLLLAMRSAASENRLVLGQARLSGEPIRPYPGQILAARGNANLRMLNLLLDPDDVVRRHPVAFQDEAGSSTPSFAAELAQRAGAALPPDDFILRQQTGPDADIYSLADLLECAAAGDTSFFKQHFSERIVLFGEILDTEDRFRTSKRLIHGRLDHVPSAGCRQTIDPASYASLMTRRSTPGVLIHAAAINSMLKGLWLNPLSAPVSALATIILVSILICVLFLVGPWGGLGILVGGLLSVWGIGLWALEQAVLLPVLLWSAALAVAYSLLYAYRFLAEDREKRWIKHAFQHYLAAPLVERLSHDPSALKLGGEKRHLTLLFSDIAGFTTISEQLRDHPEELVRIMNAYFSAACGEIEKRGGYIDKFIGDAIMAMWGAPLDDPFSPQNAVAAAVAMQEALDRFNHDLTARGLPALSSRIGIHSGIAIVGNMGSARRLNYTATGDTVNLASRLEGANKEFGSRILISESVYQALPPDFLIRDMGFLAVKGKTAAVRVYEVMGRLSAASPEVIRRKVSFEKALALFLQRRFLEAASTFRLWQDDPAARFYLRLANLYAGNPPPPDWDGRFSSETK